MSQNTESDLCSICLNPLIQSGKDLYTTSCQHRFHFECLAKSIQAQNKECPLCRTQLDTLTTLIRPATAVAAPAPVLVPPPPPAPVPIRPRPSSSSGHRSSGLWNTLRRSIGSAYNWISRTANHEGDNQVNEQEVRRIAQRIQEVRQRSAGSTDELRVITATTTLEYGEQVFNEASNIYGMVTLKAPTLLSKDATEKEMNELRVPVDLVCVVDQSGSMQGEKISLLKETLNYIIDQMNPLDRLSVISFDTQAFNRSQELLLMTPAKKERLRDIITREIQASGGTYIGAGLQMGIDVFRGRQTRNPVGAMLLLTDGQDNQHHDYTSLMERLPDGIVCHTFGYGVGHNDTLLSNIAQQGHGGTFTFIDQVDNVGLAFATAMGSFFTCVAQNIRVNIEFDGEYAVTHTHSMYAHQPQNLPSRVLTFTLHDLNAEETRNLVFQIQAPALNEPAENPNVIGRVSLNYTDAINGQPVQTAPVPFILQRPAQLDPQLPLRQVNYALDLQRNRAETSEILRRAVEMRDYDLAKELINAQIAKIRASVSAADPLCQQLIRDLEYRYQDHYQFKTTMRNMCMQHGQERATYSTATTFSANMYMTGGQERFRSLLKR